jgi:nitroreductase
MDVEDAIRGRRSIRKYSTEKVSNDDVQAILDAGRLAPSGLNNQPWRFLILSDHQKEKIAKYTDCGRIILTAPVCVGVFLDADASYNRTKDLQAVGACLQNMLLEAHGRRLGAVWLGEILNQREEVEKALGVKHELMAFVAIGHPDEKGGSPSRKKLNDLMI